VGGGGGGAAPLRLGGGGGASSSTRPWLGPVDAVSLERVAHRSPATHSARRSAETSSSLMPTMGRRTAGLSMTP